MIKQSEYLKQIHCSHYFKLRQCLVWAFNTITNINRFTLVYRILMFRLFFVHFASLLFEWDYSCSLFQFTSSVNSKVRSCCIILLLFCFISSPASVLFLPFLLSWVYLFLFIALTDVCILFALLSSNLAPVLQALPFVLIIFSHYSFYTIT